MTPINFVIATLVTGVVQPHICDSHCETNKPNTLQAEEPFQVFPYVYKSPPTVVLSCISLCVKPGCFSFFITNSHLPSVKQNRSRPAPRSNVKNSVTQSSLSRRSFPSSRSTSEFPVETLGSVEHICFVCSCVTFGCAEASSLPCSRVCSAAATDGSDLCCNVEPINEMPPKGGRHLQPPSPLH